MILLQMRVAGASSGVGCGDSRSYSGRVTMLAMSICGGYTISDRELGMLDATQTAVCPDVAVYIDRSWLHVCEKKYVCSGQYAIQRAGAPKGAARNP